MYPEKDKQLEQDKEYFFLSFSFKINVNFLNIYIVGNLTCRKSLLGLFNMWFFYKMQKLMSGKISTPKK